MSLQPSVGLAPDSHMIPAPCVLNAMRFRSTGPAAVAPVACIAAPPPAEELSVNVFPCRSNAEVTKMAPPWPLAELEQNTLSYTLSEFARFLIAPPSGAALLSNTHRLTINFPNAF